MRLVSTGNNPPREVDKYLLLHEREHQVITVRMHPAVLVAPVAIALGGLIVAVVLAMIVMYVASGPVARFVANHPTTKMLALAFLVLGLIFIVSGTLWCFAVAAFAARAAAVVVAVITVTLR